MSVTTVPTPPNMTELDLSFVAASDMSDSQYHAVYVSAVGTVSLNSASTNWLCGILQNAPASGQTAIVRVAGPLSRIVAGAAFSLGAPLMSGDSSGRLITATDNYVVQAIALETATVINQVCVALLVQCPVKGDNTN